MKIAVPSNDGVTLSEHFGRSKQFLVFEVDESKILSQEARANLPHAPHGEGCSTGSAGAHENHHGGMAALLHDCQVVVCGGMGWRAAEALKSAGITCVIASGSGPADQLVAGYLSGRIEVSGTGFCKCSH
jgi:predicted Fe-Mo cluster-binding NifX family protein